MKIDNSGHELVIDASNLPLYKSRKWHVGDTGYLIWRGRIDGKMPKKTIRFHRLVIGAKDGEIVDHINRNRLDNRRSNLRIVSHRDNCANCDRSDNSKGYYYSSDRNRWCVNTRRYGVRNLSVDSEEAAIRYVSALRSGKFPVREFTDRRKVNKS